MYKSMKTNSARGRANLKLELCSIMVLDKHLRQLTFRQLSTNQNAAVKVLQLKQTCLTKCVCNKIAELANLHLNMLKNTEDTTDLK